MRAAKEDDIRATAREVGMSVIGCRAFLEGSNPFESTREKLAAWYLRHAAGGPPGQAPDVGEAALAVLGEAIPPEKPADAMRELVDGGAVGRARAEVAGADSQGMKRCLAALVHTPSGDPRHHLPA